MFAIASDKKELIRVKKNAKDITLVLDDFSKAESERTKKRNQETVSELIQMSCDSATVLVDGGDYKKGFVHIMINREEAFKNISTINRTFSVEMKERLPLGQYNRMRDFSGKKILAFIYFLIRFIEADYDDLVVKIKADYEMFLNDARTKYQSRIANIIAVQKVLKKIIISYYRHIEFDERSIQQMDFIVDDSINRIGREMCGTIAAKKSAVNSKIVLPRLAALMCDLGNTCDLSKNEKKYWKEKDDTMGERKIGFCAKSGYLSFDMETMLSLLNTDKNYREEVSRKLFSRELKTYGLAYVDSEGKLCSRMNTKRRMYHVQIDRLLDLCSDDINDEAVSAQYKVGLYQKNSSLSVCQNKYKSNFINMTEILPKTDTHYPIGTMSEAISMTGKGNAVLRAEVPVGYFQCHRLSTKEKHRINSKDILTSK